MEIIGCGKGHYYNPELYSSCPECAKENGNADCSCVAEYMNVRNEANKFCEISATEFINSGGFANRFSGIGATEPVDFDDHPKEFSKIEATAPVNFRNFSDEFCDIGTTEPADVSVFVSEQPESSVDEISDHGNVAAVRKDTEHTEPANPNSHTPEHSHDADPVKTYDFYSNLSEKKGFAENHAQDYGVTMPVLPSGMACNTHAGIPVTPVVGWLVCVDGPAKGMDYRIYSQYNYIGRGQNMDICITGDECISADRAAVIAYDAEENYFSFGPGLGHNVVRVNGKMLMNAVVLNAYDELTIGKTRLLFVPLCCEKFNWNGK